MTDLERRIISMALQGHGLARIMGIPLEAWSCAQGEEVAKALRSTFIDGNIKQDSSDASDAVHLAVYSKLSSGGSKITLSFIESLALGDSSIAGSDTYIEQLVGMLVADANQRFVVRATEQAVRAAQQAESASAAKTQAIGLLLQLPDTGDEGDNLRTLGACLSDVLTQSQTAFTRTDAEKSKPVGVLTGLTPLDRLVGGFRRGGVWVIGAQTGRGKTVLATNMAIGAAKEGCGTVLYISLEMPGVDIARRALGSEARLSATIIENGLYDERQVDSLVVGQRRLNDIAEKVAIYDRPGLNLLALSSLVHRFHKEHDDLAAVFVDYVQLMQVPSTYSREREVAGISARLVEIARKHDVVVFALSQLNDAGKTRETQALEHDAQGVLKIQYPPEGHPDAWQPGSGDVPCRIMVTKNRHGQTGHVDATFRRSHHRFTFGTPDGWGDANSQAKEYPGRQL